MGDAHQHAAAHAQRHQGGATVGHEGQRHAHHGQDADHHADVHEGVGEDDHRHGSSQQAREQALRLAGNHQAAGNEGGVERQQDAGAHQAEFLGVDREDEVGGAFGHEVQVGLGAPQPALALKPARAHGNGGLDDVKALAQRIVGGVDHREHALFLVGLHVEPQQRHGGQAHHQTAQNDPPAQARKIDDEGAGRPDEDGGAQVGLATHQRHRQHQQHDGHQVHVAAAQPVLADVEEPGQHQRDGDLHQLGRLDAGEAQVQPALGALGRDAHQFDAEQQRQTHQIDGNGHGAQVTRVQTGHQPGDHHRHAQIAGMHHQTFAAFTSRRIHGDKADERDGQQHRRQPGVEDEDAMTQEAPQGGSVHGVASTGTGGVGVRLPSR